MKHIKLIQDIVILFLDSVDKQCLKMTKIELELISDSNMYLFLMDTIRGGICVVNKKHVKADNIYTRKVHDESSDKKFIKN